MDIFRTPVKAGQSAEKISLKTPILTVGSCFSDAIGQRLIRNKFTVLTNPFGNIYNPISIHKLLLSREAPSERSIVHHNGVFNSFDFHSDFAATTQAELLENIAHVQKSTAAFVTTARWIIITYGTAFVYEKKDNNAIVANCHKMPATSFSKRLLSVKEIVDDFTVLYSEIKKANPQINFILTVSPVRHLKDSLELNSVSKAVLRLATHEITGKLHGVQYFPSFEIMMDDLRDYRFYSSDMIHPTIDAENYIWKNFSDRFFDSQTRKFIDTWNNILGDLSHKPFHPHTEQHQQFLKKLLSKLETVKNLVDVGPELNAVKSQFNAE